MTSTARIAERGDQVAILAEILLVNSPRVTADKGHDAGVAVLWDLEIDGELEVAEHSVGPQPPALAGIDDGDLAVDNSPGGDVSGAGEVVEGLSVKDRKGEGDG